MKSLILLLLLLLHLAGTAGAQTPDTMYQQAFQEAEKGNYKQAIALLERILSHGSASAELYNNLGYCYMLNGETGRAILNLELAVRMDPANQLIRQNLALTRQQAGLYQAPEAAGVFVPLRDLICLLSLSELLSLATALFLFSLLMFSVNMYVSLKPLRYLAAMLLSLSLIVVLVGTLQLQTRYGRRDAVVLAAQTEVRSAASHKANDVTMLHEGEVVSILDQFEGWYKVALATGRTGWIRTNAVCLITPP